MLPNLKGRSDLRYRAACGMQGARSVACGPDVLVPDADTGWCPARERKLGKGLAGKTSGTPKPA
jgi:hypothetical protein